MALCGGTRSGTRFVVAPEVEHVRWWHQAPATADGGGSLPAPELGGKPLGWVAITVFVCWTREAWCQTRGSKIVYSVGMGAFY